MIAGIADTHAALWYLTQDPRLSVTARTFMDDAARAGHEIGISPISLAEIVYLVEKGRFSDVRLRYDDLKNALTDPNYVVVEAPFTVEVVDAMHQVSRTDAATGGPWQRIQRTGGRVGGGMAPWPLQLNPRGTKRELSRGRK
jgi:PIN domain nuclease of toxin-antitoxin system